MTRVSRMMLIIGVLVLIGLSALYFMAKRLQTAVQEAPQAVEQTEEADVVPIPVDDGETAAEVAGTAAAEQPAVEEAVPAVDALQERIAIFADGRRAIWDWTEKYPKVRDSIQRELTDTVKTDRVRMYNYEFMEIRLARSRPLRAAGMEESEYLHIREQYRAWRSGEGDLDPAFKAAFEAAPAEVLERADLKEFEGFDY